MSSWLIRTQASDRQLAEVNLTLLGIPDQMVGSPGRSWPFGGSSEDRGAAPEADSPPPGLTDGATAPIEKARTSPLDTGNPAYRARIPTDQAGEIME
jgi:hypothetical protein